MRVTVYHRCPRFATGAALVAGSTIWWWAELDGTAWRFRFLPSLQTRRAALAGAIEAAAGLGANPAAAVRAAQDARSEAPDL